MVGGRDEQALTYVKKALELEPNDANSLSLYGVILQHLNKKEIDPELIHKKAIALDPTNYICYQKYGTTLFFA